MSDTTVNAARTVLRITNDFVFKYVFGRDEATPVLLDFVNAVLEEASAPLASSITHLNPFSGRDAHWGKEAILDVRAQDDTGRQFDIEVQIERTPAFVNRTLYYWALLYSDQIKRGAQYHTLRPVVSISVLDHAIFAELPGNHQPFSIRHDRPPHAVLTHDFVVHYIELAKPTESTGRFGRWVQFLKSETEGTDMSAIIENDAVFHQAHAAFQRCTEDEQLRAEALAHEMFLHDQATRRYEAELQGLEAGRARGLAEGRAEGRAEGLAEGLEQGLRRTALNLKRRGMDPDLIAEVTGLGRAEVDALSES